MSISKLTESERRFRLLERLEHLEKVKTAHQEAGDTSLFCMVLRQINDLKRELVQVEHRLRARGMA